jgi:hypothetical protein
MGATWTFNSLLPRAVSDGCPGCQQQLWRFRFCRM